MRLRRVVPVVPFVLGLMLTLLSCTSDGDTGRSASAGPATGAAGALATSLRGGLATITSAHFVLTGTVAGQPISGSGDQRVADGKLTGLQATATLPTIGSIALVVDGSDRFVKVPPPFATAAKPWLRISDTSTNVVIKQLAGALDAALAAGDLGGLTDLTKAATSVRKVGSDPVDGTPATRYALIVDPSKLPGSLADPAVLGTKKIPVDLWLDSRGRPVQVKAKVTVSGQAADVRVVFGDFGSPVTITRPPASQIAAA